MNINAKYIENSIIFNRCLGSNTIIYNPNYYYGTFECDLIQVLNSGYVVEYEIKVSVADFKKDFDKANSWSGTKKHDIIKSGKRFNRFYFVVPEGLINKEDVPDYAGLIEIKYNSKIAGKCKVIKKAPLIHGNKNVVTLGSIASSLKYKMWNMKRELLNKDINANNE